MKDILRFIFDHPFTKRRRWRAVARFVRHQIRTRTQDEVIVPWVDQSRLALRRGMSGASGNVYVGLHEYSEMGLLIDYLRDTDVFLDVGANVGSWSVLAAAVRGAQAIAIEADPEAAADFRRNVEVNGIGARVRLEEVAVGPADGTVKFLTGRNTQNRVAHDGDQGVREVPCRKLDNLVAERPSFIKLDVEGFEEQVLSGASRILEDQALRVVITELCSPAILQLFRRLGFTQMYYDPGTRSVTSEPNAIHANNAIFARDVAEVRARVAAAPPARVLGRAIYRQGGHSAGSR